LKNPFFKKSHKKFDILGWGGIICVEKFYSILYTKWKTKTSIQKNQKEVFGEYLGISSLG